MTVTMTARKTVDNLGAFQDIWDAWDESDSEVKALRIEDFEVAVREQFRELRQHRDADRRDKVANEAIDIVSIALNLLRNMGYQPHEVAGLARARAENRLRGETQAILAKYQRLYDV